MAPVWIKIQKSLGEFVVSVPLYKLSTGDQTGRILWVTLYESTTPDSIMLYATLESGQEFCGHVNGGSLASNLNFKFNEITEIQADGDELEKCCDILGRNLPTKRVYTFLGNNAKEIAKNWDDKYIRI